MKLRVKRERPRKGAYMLRKIQMMGENLYFFRLSTSKLLKITKCLPQNTRYILWIIEKENS